MKINLFSILTLFLCLFLFTPLFSQTQDKIVVGVMDLDALGLDSGTKQALSDRLRTELFHTGEFLVMERNKMAEILDEQDFQQTGCTSNECVVEIGQLLGVDRMIAGSVGRVGSIYTVSLRMIDIGTGQIMLTQTEDCECPIEKVLTMSLRNVALKMAGLSSDSETKPVVKSRPFYKSPVFLGVIGVAVVGGVVVASSGGGDNGGGDNSGTINVTGGW